MSVNNTINKIFFSNNDLDEKKLKSIVSESLHGMDDGELFMEFVTAENLVFDDGHLRSANSTFSNGFGLRGVAGDKSGYAHSSDISYQSIKNAAKVIKSVGGDAKNIALSPKKTAKKLYSSVNPLDELDFTKKVKMLAEIDKYLREKDKRVRQVTVSLSGEWQAVNIIRADGFSASDIRPLIRLNVSVVVGDEGKMERGSYGGGGRKAYTEYMEKKTWKKFADEALRQALINLNAVAAPAGEMDVVLGPGWPGVLLHEAVGHGLEGDFNRKKTSAFSGLLGKRVAAKGVTVIDDGTMADRRGSINIDDEGTESQKTVLIEDGILVGYLQDRMNARLMGMKPTGSGRRESFHHQPMPRMRNTFMLGGDKSPEEIIKSVKKGIYATNFGGGQVDITSGKFVFSASEAYKIENGKITTPVKGATLIGNGPESMKQVKAIGNDTALDAGIGVCGKDRQSVPVGVGQPTLLIGGLTVGGTEV